MRPLLPPARPPVTESAGRPRAVRTRILIGLLALAVLVGACSGNDSSTSSDAASEELIDAEGPSDGGVDHLGTEEAEADRAGDDGAMPAPQLAATGRERVRTAWVTLELDDPEAAVDEVTATAEARGGFVALADLIRDDATGELGGSVTIRVPSEELLPTLDALEALAVDAPERRIEEEDVGGRLTDLRAQLTNLTAYEEELRNLLAEVREATSDPDDLLPVVERLQSVRSDIDRIRAQRDDLEERVALSTITVTLRSTPDATPLATSTWTPLRTFEEAVAATGRALAGVADGAIWIVVTALPVALVLGTPPLLAWRWLQQRRDGTGRTSSLTAPISDPTPPPGP